MPMRSARSTALAAESPLVLLSGHAPLGELGKAHSGDAPGGDGRAGREGILDDPLRRSAGKRHRLAMRMAASGVRARCMSRCRVTFSRRSSISLLRRSNRNPRSARRRRRMARRTCPSLAADRSGRAAIRTCAGRNARSAIRGNDRGPRHRDGESARNQRSGARPLRRSACGCRHDRARGKEAGLHAEVRRGVFSVVPDR